MRVDSKVIAIEQQGNSIAVKVETAGRISRNCRNSFAGRDRPATKHRRPWPRPCRNRHATHEAISRSTTSCAPASLASGRWATATVEARSRTHRGMISRSWRRIFSTTTHRRVSDRITAYALYTDPPLGRAGMTEAEVRKTGKPALISTLAMKDVMRAHERGETKGFMKILVDRDEQTNTRRLLSRTRR